MSHEAGKGDRQRPTDHEAFSANFNAIDWGRRVAELIETTEEMKLYPEQQQGESNGNVSQLR